MAICEGFEKIKKFYSDTDGGSETTILFTSIYEKLCASDTNTGNVAVINYSVTVTFIMILCFTLHSKNVSYEVFTEI